MYDIDAPIEQTTGQGEVRPPVPAAWYNLVCTHVGPCTSPFDGSPQLELILRVIDGEHKGRRFRRWVTPKFSSGAGGGKKSNLFAVVASHIFKGSAVPPDYAVKPSSLVGSAGMWQISVLPAGEGQDKNKVEGVPAPIPAGTLALAKVDLDAWIATDTAWWDKRLEEGDTSYEETGPTTPYVLADEDIPF